MTNTQKKRTKHQKPQPQVWASDDQLAALLAVSRSTIWRWVKVGILPEPVKLTPGTTRWKLSGIPMLNGEAA